MMDLQFSLFFTDFSLKKGGHNVLWSALLHVLRFQNQTSIGAGNLGMKAEVRGHIRLDNLKRIRAAA
jgi:hypothetical protein